MSSQTGQYGNINNGGSQSVTPGGRNHTNGTGYQHVGHTSSSQVSSGNKFSGNINNGHWQMNTSEHNSSGNVKIGEFQVNGPYIAPPSGFEFLEKLSKADTAGASDVSDTAAHPVVDSESLEGTHREAHIPPHDGYGSRHNSFSSNTSVSAGDVSPSWTSQEQGSIQNANAKGTKNTSYLGQRRNWSQEHMSGYFSASKAKSGKGRSDEAWVLVTSDKVDAPSRSDEVRRSSKTQQKVPSKVDTASTQRTDFGGYKRPTVESGSGSE